MRAHRHRHAARAPDRVQRGAGHAQLRLGAAPEQVGGRGRHHRHARRERRHRRGELGIRPALQMAVQQQHLVPGGLQQHPAAAELQRQMRLAAAEIDAALEAARAG